MKTSLFIRFSLILLSIFFVQKVKAEPEFEAYYKIAAFGKHLGFFITSYEFDMPKKQFRYTTFLRLNKEGTDVTESLKAISDLDFKPISYEYTQVDVSMQMDPKTKANTKITSTTTIDVKVDKKNKMTGQKVINGKKTKISLDLPKGVFFSSSLYYVMLKNPPGLKPNTNFKFEAISEELAEIKSGKSTILPKMVTYGKNNAYKVMNEFADSRYENYITEKGEILAAYTPATGISADMVSNISEATDGISVSDAVLAQTFGRKPLGFSNQLMSGGLKKIDPSVPEEKIPAKTLPSAGNKNVIQKTEQGGTNE